jgi:hypothetical protein
MIKVVSRRASSRARLDAGKLLIAEPEDASEGSRPTCEGGRKRHHLSNQGGDAGDVDTSDGQSGKRESECERTATRNFLRFADMKEHIVPLCYGDIPDKAELAVLRVRERYIVLATEYYESCDVDWAEAGKAGESGSDVDDVLSVDEDLQLSGSFLRTHWCQCLESQQYWGYGDGCYNFLCRRRSG